MFDQINSPDFQSSLANTTTVSHRSLGQNNFLSPEPFHPRLGFGNHFVRLHALLTLDSQERYFLALLQALETAALYRSEVDKQVGSRFWSNKAEALLIIEPLDGSSLARSHSFCTTSQRC